VNTAKISIYRPLTVFGLSDVFAAFEVPLGRQRSTPKRSPDVGKAKVPGVGRLRGQPTRELKEWKIGVYTLYLSIYLSISLSLSLYTYTFLFTPEATPTDSSIISFQALKVVQPGSLQDLLWVAGHSSLTNSTRPAWWDMSDTLTCIHFGYTPGVRQPHLTPQPA